MSLSASVFQPTSRTLSGVQLELGPAEPAWRASLSPICGGGVSVESPSTVASVGWVSRLAAAESASVFTGQRAVPQLAGAATYLPPPAADSQIGGIAATARTTIATMTRRAFMRRIVAPPSR
jgi:hypothetical protein